MFQYKTYSEINPCLVCKYELTLETYFIPAYYEEFEAGPNANGIAKLSQVHGPQPAMEAIYASGGPMYPVGPHSTGTDAPLNLQPAVMLLHPKRPALLDSFDGLKKAKPAMEMPFMRKVDQCILQDLTQLALTLR
jgi:hypothetical protein